MFLTFEWLSPMIHYLINKYFQIRYSRLRKDLELHPVKSSQVNRVNYTNHPISYDDIESEVLKAIDEKESMFSKYSIVAFSKSSGTTSRSKFIPISKEYLQKNYDGGKDMLAIYAYHFPDTKIFSGKNFSLTGSYEIKNKFVIGDISALFSYFLNPIYHFYREPSCEIATIPDWNQKLEAMLPILSQSDIRWIAGVPSWMKLVIDALEDYNNKSILDIWKNLEVFFYGGMDIDPFMPYYESKFQSRVRFWQTYNASEGFLGVQYRPDSKEMIFLPNTGIIYEFLPFPNVGNEPVLGLNELVPFRKYELIITTISGLNRYRIGDVVLIKSTNPYRYELIGRTTSYINAFGEELMLHNVKNALSLLSKKINFIIYDYHVSPIIDVDGTGCHYWMIEFEELPSNIEKWLYVLDKELRNTNSDYDAKRRDNMILKPPKIQVIPKGSFQKWLQYRNRSSVQTKVPKLSNNNLIRDELIAFLNESLPSSSKNI